jgi:hypothetical protein
VTASTANLSRRSFVASPGLSPPASPFSDTSFPLSASGPVLSLSKGVGRGVRCVVARPFGS